MKSARKARLLSERQACEPAKTGRKLVRQPGKADVRGIAVLLACWFGVLATPIRAAETGGGPIVAVEKIWDEAPHNAFTDLLRHDGRWYCVFREGQAHVSRDGAVRVLTSQDGKTWTSAALITASDADLRDPKITIAPDNRLMLSCAGAWHTPNPATHQSYVWYSNDGRHWGEAIPIGDPGYWIWRIVWHKDVAYGVGFWKAIKNIRLTRLYKSTDGRTFEALLPRLTDESSDKNRPNETALLFRADDTCLCVLRQNGVLNEALLGRAKPPYTDWTWQSLGRRVGAPQMLALPDGQIVVGGRKYVTDEAGQTSGRTALWWLDPESATLDEIATLPSGGGDTSYPGLVLYEGLVWMSYYSAHEGKASIYLARVKLPEVGERP